MNGGTEPPEVFEPHGSNLYHYTRLATALEHILMSGKIRMNPTMRDPRESQPWMPTIGGFGPENAFELEDAHRFAALLDELNSPGGGIRSRIKVLSLTLDDTKVDSDWDRDIYDWGFAHPRLWGTTPTVTGASVSASIGWP